MRISRMAAALPHLLKNKIVPLFWGEHGIGKTENIKQYAANNGLQLIMLNLGTQEVGDLIGLPDFETAADGHTKVTRHNVPSWFPTDPDSKGIIFLDEINRARRDVLQAIFSLVLEGRLHQATLPVGWSVVAAANPASDDYIVTDTDDKAFISRFCNIPVSADNEEWCKYANDSGVSSTVVSFVRENNKFFGSANAFSYDVIKPSFRSITLLNKLLADKPEEDVMNDFILGMLGTEAGTMFMKHAQEYQSAVKGEEVLNNWKKVKKQVKEIVTNNKRIDMLANTNEEIFTIAEKKSVAKEELTDAEYNNLKEYICTVPLDLGYALFTTLVRNDDFLLANQRIAKDKDYVDHFEKWVVKENKKKKAEEKAA